MTLTRLAAAGFLAVGLCAPAAFGDPAGSPAAPPPYVAPPPPQTCLSAGVCAPPQALPTPGPTYSPPPVFYGYGYGYPNYLGPVGGALSGAADLVNASGNYLIQQQQSRMLMTQADSARIGYRQQLIEQEMWEKSLQPTTNELRQQEQWRKLESARNNPTNPEIWSGDSLNSLLKAMQGAEVQGLQADPVPLTTDVLKHINFTTGTNSGAGAGMLKDFTNIQWPFGLQDQPFLDGATKVNALAKQAVDEVKSGGRVSAMTYKDLDATVTALRDEVAANKTLSPTDWIESKAFVDDLRGSVQSLRNPDVAQYFKGAYSPQAGTVDELVREMTAKGLRFAPAAQGDHAAYTALQQLMRTYDYRLATLAAR
jgi:hypothetical protein